MKKKEAKNYLYGLWEDGKVPSNFTEDHSEYNRGVKQIMELGYLKWDDFF
jgi:hypothetical protein|tara:strand:+ start:289 stop:438 length:150 start_codon:yes stop_codon:yes gene_type:complete